MQTLSIEEGKKGVEGGGGVEVVDVASRWPDVLIEPLEKLGR
jgi:hypothetical protein